MGICDTDLLICNKTSLIISTAAHSSSAEKGSLFWMPQEWKQGTNFLLLFPSCPTVAFWFSPPSQSLPTPSFYVLRPGESPKQDYSLSPSLSCSLIFFFTPCHPPQGCPFLWASRKSCDTESNLWLYSIAQPSTLLIPDGFVFPGSNKPLWTQEMNEIIRERRN